AHEGNVEQAGQADVADVLAAAGQEARVLLAPQRRTHAMRDLSREMGLFALVHAASTTGRIDASASKRTPSFRQNAGRSKRSPTSCVPSLSRSAQRPRSS